ncbi:MAG: hypothetical protein NZM42_11320 [Gemmatales bacterium]|nr:hypothetical protein [Gemmatales bacterium]MDW8222457.1 hypothetical protein [Gemmatales bacterium]
MVTAPRPRMVEVVHRQLASARSRCYDYAAARRHGGVLVVWLFWLFGAVGLSPSLAQAPFPEPFYVNQPNFRIPFQIEATERLRLREVQLWVSMNQGSSWHEVSRAAPQEGHFSYRAAHDGVYWFLVRTVDVEGRVHPWSVEGARPGLVVVVDTIAPRVQLQALSPARQEVGVSWEVHDEHLDLNTLELEGRLPGSDWQIQPIDRRAQGTRWWEAPPRGPVEVRLRVRDKAGNVGQASLVLPNVAGSAGFSPAPQESQASGGTLGGVPMRIVNSSEVSLAYSLEDVGPSGIACVELWMTRDGKVWTKLGEDDDRISPIIARLPGEGLYGLALAVRNGVGNGQPPPRAGEPPQLWLEVDLTPPRVQILGCEPSRGGENGILTVTWSASDKNLAARPISLYYATRPEGPWTTIATELENTGRFVWRIPTGTPYQFYLRIEAVDRAGNVGTAETSKPIIVDLSVPRGRLLGVEGRGL